MVIAPWLLVACAVAQAEDGSSKAPAPPAESPPVSAEPPIDTARGASTAEWERKLSEAAARSAEAAARIEAAAERVADLTQKSVDERKRGEVPLPPPEDMLQGDAPPITAPWSASGSIGVISLTGNSRTITLTANAQFQRKSEHWIVNGRANAVYGQGRLPDATASSVLALAAGFQGQGDRRFNARTSAYVGAGADTDHVKSVEVRGYGETGAGLIFIDLQQGNFQKAFLRTDFGIRYAREYRFQYYPTPLDVPDVTFLAPRAALSFRYALNSGVTFQQEAEVLPNLLGDSRILVNTLSKVSSRLIANISLGVSFATRYDSRPAVGKVPLDTALTVSLEAAL